MAERRMFAKTIIDSDAFLDMPLTSQVLYFHLAMRADDEGFINNPKRIQRMIGASEDDIKLLIAKSFIIPFDSGIVVIKHWRIHNYIQKDRFKPTVYTAERTQIAETKGGAYELDTECLQNGYATDTQDRIGKVRIGKVSLGESEVKENIPAPAQTKNVFGKYKNVYLTDSELENLLAAYPKEYGRKIERLSEYMHTKGVKYENHHDVILKWLNEDGSKKNANSGASYDIEKAKLEAEQGEIMFRKKG